MQHAELRNILESIVVQTFLLGSQWSFRRYQSPLSVKETELQAIRTTIEDGLVKFRHNHKDSFNKDLGEYVYIWVCKCALQLLSVIIHIDNNEI